MLNNFNDVYGGKDGTNDFYMVLPFLHCPKNAFMVSTPTYTVSPKKYSNQFKPSNFVGFAFMVYMNSILFYI